MFLFPDVTHQMMNCVTSYKYFLFSGECSIAQKFGFLFPHNMIYFMSLALNNKMKGLMIVHPWLQLNLMSYFFFVKSQLPGEPAVRPEVVGSEFVLWCLSISGTAFIAIASNSNSHCKEITHLSCRPLVEVSRQETT